MIHNKNILKFFNGVSSLRSKEEERRAENRKLHFTSLKIAKQSLAWKTFTLQTASNCQNLDFRYLTKTKKKIDVFKIYGKVNANNDIMN